MHLGQGTAICGFLARHRALLLSTAILVERGSKIPREQTERGTWRDASRPLCPRSGSRLNSPFGLQSLHTIKIKKKRGLYPSPRQEHTNFPEKPGRCLPSLLSPMLCAGLQARIPVDAAFDGKGCTRETKLPREEPPALALRLPEPLQQAFASGLASGGTGQKNQF